MKKLNAYPVYLTMQGAQGLFFSLIFTVNLVYQATTVGLNPLQLVLVGTVLEGSVFLFEIPTGIVADVYSRRLSIIIGFVLMGVGFIVEGTFPLFATVLLAQVFWGVGATFISGAEQAWIADEISHARGETKAAVGRVFLRGTQFYQAGALVGIGLSVTLASITITLPIIWGGVLFIVSALVLVLVMPEDGFTPAPPQDRHSWHIMGQTARAGGSLVRARPILVVILAVSAISGMFSEGFDRLWTPHILENFTLPVLGQLEPIVWFGIINAVTMFLTLGVAEVARRRVDTDSHQAIVRALLGLNGLLAASVIFFGLTTNFTLALAAFWLAGTLRAILGPLTMAWVNQHVESKVRATMFSMNSQADAIGQIAGGPVVGAIGTIFSLRAALVMAGLILTPALPLYARTLRHIPEIVEVEGA
jgi:DHA3 family tetracycline resistance protein-like MFS transporter